MALKFRRRVAIRRFISQLVALLFFCVLALWAYYGKNPLNALPAAVASVLGQNAASDGNAAVTTRTVHQDVVAAAAAAVSARVKLANEIEKESIEEAERHLKDPVDLSSVPGLSGDAAEKREDRVSEQYEPSQPKRSAGDKPSILLSDTPEIGARRDATGSIPVALRDMSVEQWKRIEAEHSPEAKKKLQKGSQKGAKQGSGGVFGAIDVALPLKVPMLQYPLNTGGGQAQKNIVGLKRLSKLAKEGRRKCIVYGMGIAEESQFEQMMAISGCETHAFDCTVDHEAEAVHKKKFVFHQWCIGEKPASSQSSGANTYSSGATVRLEGKLPCEDACDIDVKVVSGGKGGGGNRADFYVAGKKVKFNAGRGLNVVSVDPLTHEVLTKESYDVYEQHQKDNIRLASDLKSLPAGRIVLMAVMDTGLAELLPESKQAMRDCGASLVDGGFRESYGFIGRKGHKKVAESRSRDVPSRLIFKTLAQTMEELGHKYLDLLKFDIEGFEWDLFKSEILTRPRDDLPEQISFELHTSKANPAFVPQDVVGGKGYRQVNQLMLDLFNIGYRITSKEVNFGDPACAEFVALNVQ